MSEAYYIPSGEATGSKVPAGEYEAIISNIEVTDNNKCGAFIADVFKPVYKLVHPDYNGVEVRDNGLFRCKDKPGYQFKANRNWGFAKFCQILGIDKQENGKITLPYLELDMMDGFNVIININYKSFVNKEGSHVSYPVATLKKKIKEVPF